MKYVRCLQDVRIDLGYPTSQREKQEINTTITSAKYMGLVHYHSCKMIIPKLLPLEL